MESPVIISPRLMPGVRVAGAFVSVEYAGGCDRNGKPQWRYAVDLPNGAELVGDDLYGWGNAGEMLSTLLSFLGACGESVNYRDRTGRGGDSAELFPPAVATWAAANCDELALVQFELDESARA